MISTSTTCNRWRRSPCSPPRRIEQAYTMLPRQEDKTDPIQGIYSVLVEARIPFDFVHEEDLPSDERLSR